MRRAKLSYNEHRKQRLIADIHRDLQDVLGHPGTPALVSQVYADARRLSSTRNHEALPAYAVHRAIEQMRVAA